MTKLRRSPVSTVSIVVLLLAVLFIAGVFLFSKLLQDKQDEAPVALPIASPVQEIAADGVVYGILLYSPTCPHCQEVITQVWPQFRNEFGDHLELLFIDTTSSSGQTLTTNIYDYYAIPPEARVVPMMMIGDAVFVGTDQIPTTGHETIRAGIAAGGVPLPPVPGLAEAYEQASQIE
ncbi:MAG: hypothetical protein JXJ17_07085 [Anaerolineae bacterium]|nr:hypothetical protein [Anaerolineae bacterium]